MTKRLFFMFYVLLVLVFPIQGADDDSYLKKIFISPYMVQEAQKTHTRIIAGQEYDLISLAKQGKYEEATKESKRVSICNIHWTKENEKTKEIVDIGVFYINVFLGYRGYIDLFQWNPSKGGKNFSIIDQYYHKHGHSDIIRNPGHCTGLTYTFNKLINNETIWTYEEGKGYEAKPITIPTWYCTADHIYTDETHKHKGMATHAVGEFVKFVFHATSAEFIITSAANHRPYSQATFEKNEFIKILEIKKPEEPGYGGAYSYSNEMQFITLDEGKTYILPAYYSGSGGNYYLSRQRWQRLQAEKKS